MTLLWYFVRCFGKPAKKQPERAPCRNNHEGNLAYYMSIAYTYQRILGIICSVFDAHSAVLILPVGSERYTPTAFFSLSDTIDAEAEILPGQGLAGWIIRNQAPLMINNFDQRQSHIGYYVGHEESAIKAFMGCPLRNGGALCVDSKRQYSFVDKDMKLLNLFADFLSSLIVEATRSDEQAHLVRYHDALHKIYGLRAEFTRWPVFIQEFLELIASTTGFDYALFAARDSDGQNYLLEGENHPVFIDRKNPERRLVPAASGLIGWVFRHGTPIFTEGEADTPLAPLLGKGFSSPPFHSVICLPLVIHKIPRGVLCLAHSVPHRISPELQTFVHMSVDHLTLFLENLYLKSRLRELLTQQPARENTAQRPEASGAEYSTDT